jgi:hypothetical protein
MDGGHCCDSKLARGESYVATIAHMGGGENVAASGLKVEIAVPLMI